MVWVNWYVEDKYRHRWNGNNIFCWERDWEKLENDVSVYCDKLEATTRTEPNGIREDTKLRNSLAIISSGWDDSMVEIDGEADCWVLVWIEEEEGIDIVDIDKGGNVKFLIGERLELSLGKRSRYRNMDSLNKISFVII